MHFISQLLVSKAFVIFNIMGIQILNWSRIEMAAKLYGPGHLNTVPFNYLINWPTMQSITATILSSPLPFEYWSGNRMVGCSAMAS